jgi:hypothetical protein
MLNFRVLSRWASEKEVATCWYEYPINHVKPWAGMLQSRRSLGFPGRGHSRARWAARQLGLQRTDGPVASVWACVG